MCTFLKFSWRKFKRSLEALGYGLFDGLVLFFAPTHCPQPGHVAIVHLELLGDMALWLPYGQALVKHYRNQGQKVSLIIDSSFLSIAERAFPDIQLVPLSKSGFLRSPRQRALSLRLLRSLGVNKTLHPRYSRDGIFMDETVRALGAPAIGFAAVFEDRPCFDRILSNRLYQRLIPSMGCVHQNTIHRAFLLELGVNLASVTPADIAISSAPLFNDTYWLLVPGASRLVKQWPIEHFVSVAHYIKRLHPNWRCVIVGTEGEWALGRNIARTLEGDAVNLVGQTDLPSLLNLIAHARLVIGNDSAAGHLAAVLGAPSVIVVGGGHWGRFYPYDPDHAPVRRLPHAVSAKMSCFGCDWFCRFTIGMNDPFPCIESVQVEDVMKAIDYELAN